jgi:dTDP-4-amino-4,6-dideoxygalactose transaminase
LVIKFGNISVGEINIFVHEFRDLGFKQSLPFTEKMMKNSLMIPLNMMITDDEVKYICKCNENQLLKPN